MLRDLKQDEDPELQNDQDAGRKSKQLLTEEEIRNMAQAVVEKAGALLGEK